MKWNNVRVSTAAPCWNVTFDGLTIFVYYISIGGCWTVALYKGSQFIWREPLVTAQIHRGLQARMEACRIFKTKPEGARADALLAATIAEGAVPKTGKPNPMDWVDGTCSTCNNNGPVLPLKGCCEKCLIKAGGKVFQFTPPPWARTTAQNVDEKESAAAATRALSAPQPAKSGNGGSAGATATTSRTAKAPGTASTPKTPPGSAGKR